MVTQLYECEYCGEVFNDFEKAIKHEEGCEFLDVGRRGKHYG